MDLFFAAAGDGSLIITTAALPRPPLEPRPLVLLPRPRPRMYLYIYIYLQFLQY